MRIWLYNFLAGDRLVEPGTNPACPAGGVSMWEGLLGSKDVGAAIAASDLDMAALDGRNTQANQIVRAERVVIWFIVRPLTTQQEVGTC